LGGPLSLANDGRKKKAVFVADRSPIRVESAVHEVICLLSDISDSDGVEDHVQSVQDERGSQMRAEREDVFQSFHA
jgi:hypothetical protein